MLHGKRILLIIAGGIAAYKSLDLIRRLREAGARVRCVLTAGGAQFITPLAVAALSEERVATDLFSLTDESEMGHIRLSREADLILVAPATADLIARMAQGRADDLAASVLLAADKPVLIAPSMNVMMWNHPATQANVATLLARGVKGVGPGTGAMACGETGTGRLAEVSEIVAAVGDHFRAHAPLSGRRALVTSGPTHEAIDPVRYLANRSSGKQGHAVAAALARLGAATTLVSGPTSLADPPGVSVVRIESAREMAEACRKLRDADPPLDIGVFAAAVADWRTAEASPRKIKKIDKGPPALELVANPDILAEIAAPGNRRPRLVVGFAAETENLAEFARDKRRRKNCDWVLANDISPETGIMGGDENEVLFVFDGGSEPWPRAPKEEIAERLALRIARHFAAQTA